MIHTNEDERGGGRERERREGSARAAKLRFGSGQDWNSKHTNEDEQHKNEGWRGPERGSGAMAAGISQDFDATRPRARILMSSRISSAYKFDPFAMLNT